MKRASQRRAAEKERIEADKAKVEKAAEMGYRRRAQPVPPLKSASRRLLPRLAKQGERAADKAASGGGM